MDRRNDIARDESVELSRRMQEVRRQEESQARQEMNEASAPHIYIERGINRHAGSGRDLRRERKRVENAPLSNPLAEYREAPRVGGR